MGNFVTEICAALQNATVGVASLPVVTFYLDAYKLRATGKNTETNKKQKTKTSKKHN